MLYHETSMALRVNANKITLNSASTNIPNFKVIKNLPFFAKNFINVILIGLSQKVVDLLYNKKKYGLLQSNFTCELSHYFCINMHIFKEKYQIMKFVHSFFQL